MKVTVQSFRDYLNCKRKLFLREQGETGEENNYARFIAESRERFGAQVISVLSARLHGDARR
jgi:CRISPR/Cas system-associated exonuclease Cas4 (RecB family)